MPIRTEQVQTVYKMDATQALNQIGIYQNDIKALNAALNTVQRQAENAAKKMAEIDDKSSTAWKKAYTNASNLRTKISDLNTELDQQTAKVKKLVEQEGLAALTNNKLKNYYTQLYYELNSKLIPGTDAYIAKLKELKVVEAAIIKRKEGFKPAKESFNSLIPGISLGSVAAGLGIGSVASIGQDILEVGALNERLNALILNSLRNNKQAAAEATAIIKDFADKSPLKIEEVTNSFQRLTGIGIIPTKEQLVQMSDVAISKNKTIKDFIEAIADAQQGENERLKEFGINAKKSGDSVIFTYNGVSTTVKNTRKAISDYLIGLGKLPGIQGATEASAKTLSGRWSTLKDNLRGIATDIYNFVAPALSFLLANLNRSIKGVSFLINSTINGFKLAGAFLTGGTKGFSNKKEELTIEAQQKLNITKPTQKSELDKLRDEYLKQLDKEGASTGDKKDTSKENDKLADRLKRQAELEAEYSLRRLKLYADETDRKILDADAAAKKEVERLKQDLADKVITQQQYKAAVLTVNQELGIEINKILQDNTDKQNKLATETAEKARKLAADTAIARAEIDVSAAEDSLATARTYEEKKAALYGLLFRQNYLLFLQEETESFGKTEAEKYLIALKYAQKRQELATKNSKELIDLSDKEKERLNKNEEDKLKKRQKAAEEALQIAQQGIGFIFDFAAIALQKEQIAADTSHNQKLANLERDKQAGLVSEESYQQAKSEIERNYSAQTRAIKRKQAEQDKIAAIFQATIAGAVGIIQNLKNPALAIVAGITAAAQIAKIVATPIPEFAQGGYTDAPAAGRTQLGRKPSPTAMLAWVNEQGRERIISNAELRNPVVANLVSVIDGLRYSRPKAYAAGGYTDGYRPAPATSAAPQATDSQLQTAILEALNKINQRFEQPIEAVWQWNAFKKGYDQITNIRQNAKITD